MPRWMVRTAVLVAATAAVGCGSGKEQPVIPTAIQQPPGPDTEGGKKKPADARGGLENKDG